MLQSLARITLFSIIRSLLTTCVVLGAVGWAVRKSFLVKKWVKEEEEKKGKGKGKGGKGKKK
jgi:hypothetical protein